MKYLYCCEKCGATYEDMREAEACEEMHLAFCDRMDEETAKHSVWRKGKALPVETYLAALNNVWNEEKQEAEERFVFGRYILKEELEDNEGEAAEIMEEYEARKKRVDEQFRKWQEEWNAKQEAKKAEEAAKTEQDEKEG